MSFVWFAEKWSYHMPTQH